MTGADPRGRWRYQRQRVADVVQQRIDQLQPEWYGHDGQHDHCTHCHIKRLVDAAPPLTPEQLDRLALLLSPWSPA